MRFSRNLAIVATAMAVVAGTADVASARGYHRRHYRHHEYRQGGGSGLGFIAGTTLGLLGVGIAGASAADNGYGYGFPTYGSGYPGFGAYGPGYGYYGY